MHCLCGHVRIDGKPLSSAPDDAKRLACKPMSIKVSSMSNVGVRSKRFDSFTLSCHQCFCDFDLVVSGPNLYASVHRQEPGRRCSQPDFVPPLANCFPISLRKFITESPPDEPTPPTESPSNDDFGTIWHDEEPVAPAPFSLTPRPLLCDFVF